MSTDPLSEARETLREIWRENSHGATASADWITTVAEKALARLDALPAPIYRENILALDFGLIGEPRGVWIYPDAPLADAAPRQQPPVAREDGGET